MPFFGVGRSILITNDPKRMERVQVRERIEHVFSSPSATVCSATGTDCTESKCCQDAGHKCYSKDQNWASCKQTCDSTEVDPADNQTWDCAELNETSSLQCSKEHENCQANPKCCHAGWSCYIKDGGGANCSADCIQGEGANSCEIHDFRCRTITNLSNIASKDVAEKLLKCCQEQKCAGAECIGDYANKCTFYERKLAQAWVKVNIRWAMHPDHCLEVSGGVNQDGTNIQLWDCANDGEYENMQFLVPPSGQGVIRWAKHPTKCLDVAGGGTKNGANLQIFRVQRAWRGTPACSSLYHFTKVQLYGTHMRM